MNWTWIALLSLTGLVMGLLTSLVGLPTPVELGTWVACYVAWGVLITRRDLPPFSTAFGASLLSGVWTAGTQFLLWDSYVANNPWYAEELAETSASLPQLLGFALGMGAFWGLLVGGVCWGTARRRA